METRSEGRQHIFGKWSGTPKRVGNLFELLCRESGPKKVHVCSQYFETTVGGRALTTTPVFGPSVVPPRLSFSLMLIKSIRRPAPLAPTSH